jgi:6-phosphogluconolactonase (cycloisomerase 2 family)
MRIYNRALFLLLLGGLSACGGGGSGGGGGGVPQPLAPPSNLVYPSNDTSAISQVAFAPLTPTVVGQVDNYTIVPGLPTGLVLDVATGAISGTPSAPATRHTYDVAAANASGSTHFALTLTVVAPPRFVYSVSSSDDTISIFADDLLTGALVRRGFVVTGGAEHGPEKLFIHPSGRFAYAPNLATSNISVFGIDPDSGWLTKKAPVPCSTGPHAMAIDPTGNFAYVANRGTNEIDSFAIDPTTGDLTTLVAPFLTGTQPSAVDIDPTGAILFVALAGADFDGEGSTLVPYRRNLATGTLTLAASLKLNGGRPVSLCVHPFRSVVFVTLGAFSTILPVRFDLPTGELHPVGLRPTGTNPSSIAVDPHGGFAYVGDQGDGTIHAYSVDATTGGVTPIGVFGAGGSPTAVIVDPTGEFAYASASDSQVLTTYRIDGGNGMLSALDSRVVRGAPMSVRFGLGDHPTKILPRFVHVAGSSSGDVTSYAIDAATGALTQSASVLSGTNTVSVAVDPRLRFVYSANEDAGSIGIFSIGAMGALGGSIPAQPIGGRPTHVAIDRSARFLYAVARDVVVPDDGRLTAFAIDAASGALTVLSAQDVGFDPVWVETDPTGRFLYVANGGTGASGSSSISIFSIDPITGEPTSSATPADAPGVSSLAFHPNGRFVYATLSASNVLVQYAIDLATGALALQPAASFTGIDPASIAFAPSGRFAYVASRGGATSGGLGQYAVASNGGFGPAMQTLNDGVNPSDLAVEPSGRFLYAVNRGSDTVSILALDAVNGSMSAHTPAMTGVAPVAIAVSGVTQ